MVLDFKVIPGCSQEKFVFFFFLRETASHVTIQELYVNSGVLKKQTTTFFFFETGSLNCVAVLEPAAQTLELIHPSPSASPTLGVKVCATTSTKLPF